MSVSATPRNSLCGLRWILWWRACASWSRRAASGASTRCPTRAFSRTVVGALTERGVFNLATTLPTGTGSLPTIDIVDWGARPESGARLLSSAFLKTMGDAEAILQAQFGQTVGQRTVYLRAQEFHFGIQGISLWFDAQSSLEVQLQRYRTFLQSVGLSSAREYIDLRIADKVIYR